MRLQNAQAEAECMTVVTRDDVRLLALNRRTRAHFHLQGTLGVPK